MNKVGAAAVAIIALAVPSIPFVGWQARWYRDTNESPTEIWEPFIKQSATLRMVYFNPLDCGVCEERGLDDPSTEDRLELIAVCHDRYGLTSVAECTGRSKW